MRKIPKWLKITLSLILSLTIFITPMSFLTNTKVSAAPALALVPLGVETVGELLAVLGIAVATGVGTYSLTQEYPYIHDTLSKFGDTVSDWINAFPKDVYYQDPDSGDWYIGKDAEVLVTGVSDLVLKGDALLTDYTYPVNVKAVRNTDPQKWMGNASGNISANLYNLWSVYEAANLWLIPWAYGSATSVEPNEGAVAYAMANMGLNINPYAGTLSIITHGASEVSTIPFTFNTFGMDPYLSISKIGQPSYILPNYRIDDNRGYIPELGSGYVTIPGYSVLPWQASAGEFVFKQGSSIGATGFLVCEGVPTTSLVVDKDKLTDVIVSVDSMPPAEIPPDDDDDEPWLPFYPPSEWEIFKDILDWILKKTTGENTNNDTTVTNYVNNDYTFNITVNPSNPSPEDYKIYLSGDVNVKQDITADVNLGGNVNINIDINENVSLPDLSAGNGDNFFSADAVDAISGLTTNNPILRLVYGIFAAIDPALLGIVSVGISLMILLGIWKLIRG